MDKFTIFSLLLSIKCDYAIYNANFVEIVFFEKGVKKDGVKCLKFLIKDSFLISENEKYVIMKKERKCDRSFFRKNKFKTLEFRIPSRYFDSFLSQKFTDSENVKRFVSRVKSLISFILSLTEKKYTYFAPKPIIKQIAAML